MFLVNRLIKAKIWEQFKCPHQDNKKTNRGIFVQWNAT